MTNPNGDFSKGSIKVGPLCQKSGIGGKWTEMGKWSTLPIHRTQEDGDHTDPFFLLALQSLLHLSTIAIVGGKKIRADQQQDNGRALKMDIRNMLPIFTS